MQDNRYKRTTSFEQFYKNDEAENKNNAEAEEGILYLTFLYCF